MFANSQMNGKKRIYCSTRIDQPTWLTVYTCTPINFTTTEKIANCNFYKLSDVERVLHVKNETNAFSKDKYFRSTLEQYLYSLNFTQEDMCHLASCYMLCRRSTFFRQCDNASVVFLQVHQHRRHHAIISK